MTFSSLRWPWPRDTLWPMSLLSSNELFTHFLSRSLHHLCALNLLSLCHSIHRLSAVQPSSSPVPTSSCATQNPSSEIYFSHLPTSSTLPPPPASSPDQGHASGYLHHLGFSSMETPNYYFAWRDVSTINVHIALDFPLLKWCTHCPN